MSISTISNFIFGGALLFIYIFLGVMILTYYFMNKKYTKSYYIAAIDVVSNNNDIDKMVEGIKNIYEVYRKHRYGFAYKDIVNLNQSLVFGIRDQKLKDYLSEDKKTQVIDNIELIIVKLRDEFKFDDNRANELINEIENIAGINLARKIKEYFIGVNAFNEGRIMEKKLVIMDMEEKIKKKSILNKIASTFGILGTLASIYSLFK